MSSALRRIHFVGCPRIGAPVFLWEFCSKVTTEWLFYKCSEWSVAAREMQGRCISVAVGKQPFVTDV